MNSDKQNNLVSFTKKQFKSLMKVVYLGNWMANAHRTDDKKKEYEGIENYIFSLAPQFGFDQYVHHEKSDGKHYYPTSDFEEGTDVHILHEAYDEETFWDELAERLGKRDFMKKFTKQEIEEMERDECFTKLYECIDKWNEEFYEHGIERLSIKSSNNKF